MHTLALTPVIELGYYNQGNEMPSLEERRAFSREWIEYREECMRLAGMPDPLPPEFPGTDFYTLSAFSGDRLDWLIKQHVSDYIHEEPEQICPLFGGYVLSDSAGTLLNPQCCGDLSDVMWWKHICYRMESVYYNGHPCPQLAFSGNLIEFTCLDEYDHFDPLTKPRFAVKQDALIAAYENMIPTLMRFKHSIVQALERLDLPRTGIDLASVLTVKNVELDEQDPGG